MGTVVRSFSGPVDSQNANEAEVDARLIDCRELSRLGGFNEVTKGDSSWLFSGGSESLLLLGDWRIGLNRFRMLLVSWAFYFIMF